MYYRLDSMEGRAAELGLRTRRVDADRLDVTLWDDCTLTFANMRDEEDSLVGFDGTPWHSHGEVEFLTSPASSVTYDELDLLIAIAAGELVIITEYAQGVVRDRLLAHKAAPLDVSYVRPGDEVRVLAVTASPREP